MTAASRPVDLPDPPDPPTTAVGTDDPGLRGRLTIAPRVVERVAQHAVSEVDLATGAPARVLGIAVGSSGERARVHADVHHDVAEVTVQMSVAWPASVREVTDQVRSRVVARLAELAGITRSHVTIRVGALRTPEPAQARRVL